MTGRAVAMSPMAGFGRQQVVDCLKNIGFTASASLYQRDTGSCMWHEYREQPVALVGAEPCYFFGEIYGRRFASGSDAEFGGFHDGLVGFEPTTSGLEAGIWSRWFPSSDGRFEAIVCDSVRSRHNIRDSWAVSVAVVRGLEDVLSLIPRSGSLLKQDQQDNRDKQQTQRHQNLRPSIDGCPHEDFDYQQWRHHKFCDRRGKEHFEPLSHCQRCLRTHRLHGGIGRDEGPVQAGCAGDREGIGHLADR